MSKEVADLVTEFMNKYQLKILDDAFVPLKKLIEDVQSRTVYEVIQSIQVK